MIFVDIVENGTCIRGVCCRRAEFLFAVCVSCRCHA
jgi:hypothetical protein